jgi:hypothetical protein
MIDEAPEIVVRASTAAPAADLVRATAAAAR